jgi:hypothetical protein
MPSILPVDDAVHPVFAEVIELATAREHIFLPGPAGCGTSPLAAQVAEAMGLKLGFISCSAGMNPTGQGTAYDSPLSQPQNPKKEPYATRCCVRLCEVGAPRFELGTSTLSGKLTESAKKPWFPGVFCDFSLPISFCRPFPTVAGIAQETR